MISLTEINYLLTFLRSTKDHDPVHSGYHVAISNGGTKIELNGKQITIQAAGDDAVEILSLLSREDTALRYSGVSIMPPDIKPPNFSTLMGWERELHNSDYVSRETFVEQQTDVKHGYAWHFIDLIKRGVSLGDAVKAVYYRWKNRGG